MSSAEYKPRDQESVDRRNENRHPSPLQVSWCDSQKTSTGEDTGRCSSPCKFGQQSGETSETRWDLQRALKRGKELVLIACVPVLHPEEDPTCASGEQCKIIRSSSKVGATDWTQTGRQSFARHLLFLKFCSEDSWFEYGARKDQVCFINPNWRQCWFIEGKSSRGYETKQTHQTLDRICWQPIPGDDNATQVSSSQRNVTLTTNIFNNNFFSTISPRLGITTWWRKRDSLSEFIWDCSLTFSPTRRKKYPGRRIKKRTQQRDLLIYPRLNSVVISFIIANMKMERIFFREYRVRSRSVLLEKICCLSLLVKYKVFGYSVKFGKQNPVASYRGGEDVDCNEVSPSRATRGRMKEKTSSEGNSVLEENELRKNSETASASKDGKASTNTDEEQFNSLPKTRKTSRMKFTGLYDSILGADKRFPLLLVSYCYPKDKPYDIPKRSEMQTRLCSRSTKVHIQSSSFILNSRN